MLLKGPSFPLLKTERQPLRTAEHGEASTGIPGGSPSHEPDGRRSIV